MNPLVSVFSDTVCTLGEGPAAHPGLGRLFWFDIIGKRLLEKPFHGSGTVVHQLPVHASIMAVIDGDRQLIGAEDGLYVRDIATGRLDLHTPLLGDDPTTRSNDGRVHPCGALWISTMRWDPSGGGGAIWWFYKGRLERIFDGIAIGNAISFAPDGSHAYFACTRAGTIWRVATDPETGRPIGDRQLFHQSAPGDGGPDGAVVDADGLLWNARWGAGVVRVFAPDGSTVRTIQIPAGQVSCPAFVGPAADRLAVTTAREGMDDADLAADPLAGQTFLIDLPVRGRFDPPVAIA